MAVAAWPGLVSRVFWIEGQKRLTLPNLYPYHLRLLYIKIALQRQPQLR